MLFFKNSLVVPFGKDVGMIRIKGYELGEGMPLVCVPVMKRTKEGILEEAGRLADAGTQMIEWRVDAFEHAADMNALREVLLGLKPLTERMILVYTFRSKAQGGLLQLSPEIIYDIHQIAAETQIADLIDVEYFASKNPRKEISALQRMGARVIASHHDFDETPKPEIMRMLLEQMSGSGADVVKLAVMPQSEADMLALLFATLLFHEKNPDKPLITMSMGSLGCLSRVAGESVGSCVTFGAGEQASAPGQLPAEELGQVLRILHDSRKGN